jgi:hypothetical protein
MAAPKRPHLAKRRSATALHRRVINNPFWAVRMTSPGHVQVGRGAQPGFEERFDCNSA